MVIYTGIDTEMISRFAHLWEKKPALLKKIFFPSELSYFANQGYHIATLTGIWCAKEAVVKAVYPTIRLHIREVEIIAQKKNLLQQCFIINRNVLFHRTLMYLLA